MGDQRRHEVFRRAAVGGSGGETRGGEESGRGGGGDARVNERDEVYEVYDVLL